MPFLEPFEKLVGATEEFWEMQAVDFVLEGIIEQRMLISLIELIFTLSNRRDFFLANLEKVVSSFISLESFSFLKQRSCSLTGFWRQLNILNIEIANLDLILVQQLITAVQLRMFHALKSFVCCLE